MATSPVTSPHLREELAAALGEHFGLTSFRPGQEDVVAAIMSGQDVLAIMPTGAGKSLCYQLPALLLPTITLVISPLIALMKDQMDRWPAQWKSRIALVNSTLEPAELDLALAAIATGYTKVVYAAPERLRHGPFMAALRAAGVSLVVVDEAHCLSLWGSDFRPDYLFIGRQVAALSSAAAHRQGAPRGARGGAATGQEGRPTVLALTATATTAITREIGVALGREMRVARLGALRDNLFLAAHRVANEDEKLRALFTFLEDHEGPSIVYVSSRERCEEVARLIGRRGHRAVAYHAGMELSARTAVQDAFMEGRARVVVATVAFGMGIDKGNVRSIVHFNPPRSLEAYVQESGRAGRDGGEALCLLLYSLSDRTALGRWLRDDRVSVETLRSVYGAVRGTTRQRWHLFDARARADVSSIGETTIRVCISILEKAGLLRRGRDFPRAATLALRPPQAHQEQADGQLSDPLWPPFLEATALREHEVAALDLLALSGRLDVSPEELEDRVLEWQEGGRLTYRGIGRDMLIEVLPPPSDVATGLQSLLAAMAERDEGRLAALLSFLEATRCRRQIINRYFGLPEGGRCGACNVCDSRRLVVTTAPHAAARALPDSAATVIMTCLREMPFPVGKPGLLRILTGSPRSPISRERCRQFGLLAGVRRAELEREVDRLVSAGALEWIDKDGYRVLRVSGD